MAVPAGCGMRKHSPPVRPGARSAGAAGRAVRGGRCRVAGARPRLPWPGLFRTARLPAGAERRARRAGV